MPSAPRAKRLALLHARDRGGTSDFALRGVDRAFARAGLPLINNDKPAIRFVGKVLKRARLQGSIGHRPDLAYVVALMGPQFFRAFPQGVVSELIPYIFDCWPAQYPEWERFFRAHRVSIAFFSAQQSAERMAERVPGLDARWMPEAIDSTRYGGDAPLTQRRIDLLELGRRNEQYHDQITAHCVARGYAHRYQRGATELAFTTREAFLRGLGDTKVMTCFPSSMTHPERSGDVETLTLRYLEGIASGAVLLGHCPKELRTLFGYDPVVAANLDRPGEQLDAILGSLQHYAPLVARNSARLAEVGTWDRRVATMLAALAAKGYGVGSVKASHS